MIKVKRIRNGNYSLKLDGVEYIAQRHTSRKASGVLVDEWTVSQGDMIICTASSLKSAKEWLTTPIVNQHEV